MDLCGCVALHSLGIPPVFFLTRFSLSHGLFKFTRAPDRPVPGLSVFILPGVAFPPLARRFSVLLRRSSLLKGPARVRSLPLCWKLLLPPPFFTRECPSLLQLVVSKSTVSLLRPVSPPSLSMVPLSAYVCRAGQFSRVFFSWGPSRRRLPGKGAEIALPVFFRFPTKMRVFFFFPFALFSPSLVSQGKSFFDDPAPFSCFLWMCPPPCHTEVDPLVYRRICWSPPLSK